jgi:hypothetical protein
VSDTESSYQNNIYCSSSFGSHVFQWGGAQTIREKGKADMVIQMRFYPFLRNVSDFIHMKPQNID